MLIQKAYKTEVDPNNKQITLLLKHAGCARKAWNWALDKIQKKESKPNAMQLHKELNIKKQSEFAYMYEVSKCAMQESLRDLQKSFKNFFEKRAGFPKYKSKNKRIGSFRLTGCIHVEEKRIKLPRIGWLKLKENGYIPVDKHILSVTVSEKTGRWFVSILVKEEIKEQKNTNKVIGIDLGIKTLATCSDGSQYGNPNALAQLENKIKYCQRRLSKKDNKSNRRKKLRTKIAKLWQKVENIRKDATHKASSDIVKTKQPQIIVMEKLNIKGMIKNHNLAKSVCDANMGEFRRQIEYKAKWQGIEVRLVDQFFPSSKICSNCGSIKKNLKLSERKYRCVCGLNIDRDLNASYNLRNTVSSTEINAHGDDKVHVKELTGDHRRSENQT
jgi:putative transposase